jgi:hypothetical protein
MKNISFLFGLTILCCTSIIAQRAYIPVAQSGKFWFYEVYESYEEDGRYYWIDKVVLNRVLYCGDDTLVDNMKYHKLYHFTETPIELEDMENHLIALIRDDTLERKTYLLPIDTTFQFCEHDEHLIFDFSLQESDYVDSCLVQKTSYNQPMQHFVYGYVLISWEGIVNWLNAPLPEIRTIIQFEATNFFERVSLDNEILVEGLGLVRTNNGFFYDRFSRIVRYCEGTLEDCGLIVRTSEIDKQAVRISILPNPVYDYMRVEASVDYTWISIMDVHGKEVLRVNQSEVDVSHLHPGLYILRVQSKGQYYVKEFVKR